jgi:PAS domain S-box-containing protein
MPTNMIDSVEKKSNPLASVFKEGHIAALYAAIIDSSNDAIISKSLEGIIQSWNKSSEKIFGYTADEVIGKHISLLMHEDRISEEEEMLQKIRQKQTIVHWETIWIGKDGTHIDVSVTVSPLIDTDGNVVGASKIARDITAKKVIENVLAAATEGLKSQTDDTLEILKKYLLQDFSQQIKVSNRGDGLDSIAVGLNTMGMALQTLLQTEKRNVKQLEQLNASLEKRVVERTVELSQYKYALDEASLVEITDTNGIILHVNENKCRVAGYTKEELIGQDNRINNSNYHPKEFMANLWETISSGKIWKGEFRNKAKDGSLYWVESTIVPFVDDEGKVYQYMAIKTDITIIKKIEAERDQRSVELLAVNKELESFSYSVSHDLRAPLRAIDGYALMLEEDYETAIDQEGKRLLSTIRHNASYMGNLIDDLLNFSQLGRKELVKAHVDMTALAKATVIEIGKNKKNTANITIHPLHSIMADKSLIACVWVNLISNAIKYSAKKENSIIEVSSKVENNEVVYCVKDNGAGFEMEYIDKLFGVFQRLHTAEEFEGTGVGLATAQRIIHKHGGKIWAEAEVGKGAAFYFSMTDKKQQHNPKL